MSKTYINHFYKQDYAWPFIGETYSSYNGAIYFTLNQPPFKKNPLPFNFSLITIYLNTLKQ